MSKDNIRKLPKLIDGGVGVPNPGQFTFNPQGVSAGAAASFQSQAKPTDTSGIVQVLQNKDNFDLKNAQLQQKIADDKARLAVANAKEQRAIKKGLLDRYKIGVKDVATNYAIDETTKSGRALKQQLEKEVDAMTAQQHQAILSNNGNTSTIDNDLAKIKAEGYERINNIPGLQVHQDLVRAQLGLGKLTTGYSKGRVGERSLEIAELLNSDELPTDFDIKKYQDYTSLKDNSAGVFKQVDAVTNSIFGEERKVVNEGGYRFLETTLTEGDSAEAMAQSRKLIRANEDAMDIVESYGFDPDDDDSVNEFIKLEIAATREEKTKGLPGLKSIGKDEDPETTEDYDGLSAVELQKALQLTNSSKGDAAGVAREINKYRAAGETPSQIRDNRGQALLDTYNKKSKSGTSGTGGGTGSPIEQDTTDLYTFGKNKSKISVVTGFDGTSVQDEKGDVIAGASLVDRGGKEYIAIDYNDSNAQNFLVNAGFLNKDTILPGENKVNIDEINDKGVIREENQILIPAGPKTRKSGSGSGSSATGRATKPKINKKDTGGL